MSIPEDFKFAENADIDTFIVGTAELMFGKDWRSRDDLKLSRPFTSWFFIRDNEEGGLELQVERNAATGDRIVSCLKGGEFEDPAANYAAHCCFYESGKQARASHYSGGHKINPPAGTPSIVHYNEESGVVDACWYVNAKGKVPARPASKKEIAARIAAAKRIAATTLCDGVQDVIALKAGSNLSQSIGMNPPSPCPVLRA